MKYECRVLSLTSWGEKGRKAKEIYTPSCIRIPRDISNESIEHSSRIFPLVGGGGPGCGNRSSYNWTKVSRVPFERKLAVTRSGFRGKPQTKKTNKGIKGK